MSDRPILPEQNDKASGSDVDDSTCMEVITVRDKSSNETLEDVSRKSHSPKFTSRVEAVHMFLSDSHTIDETMMEKVYKNLLNMIEFDKYEYHRIQGARMLAQIASKHPELIMKIIRNSSEVQILRIFKLRDPQIYTNLLKMMSSALAGSTLDTNLFVERKIFHELLSFVRETTDTDLLCQISWIILNLCGYKKDLKWQPTFQLVIMFIPILDNLIREYNDADIIFNALQSLEYITEMGSVFMNYVIHCGFIPSIISLLNHHTFEVIEASITVLEVVAKLSNEGRQILIDCEILREIQHIIQDHDGDQDLINSALRILTSILTDNHEQIETVIQSDVIPHVVHLFAHGDMQTNLTASHCILNFAKNGTIVQVQYLIKLEQDVMHWLSNFVKQDNTDLVDISSKIMGEIAQHYKSNVSRKK